MVQKTVRRPLRRSKASAAPARRPRSAQQAKENAGDVKAAAAPQAGRKRGRPRAYDPELALARAQQTFWEHGYAGASLDQLSEATDMNRPSLYAAFGDKRALYLQALDSYVSRSSEGLERALAYDVPLADALRRLYSGALSLYLPPGEPPRGCFLISTALTDSFADEAVRDRVSAVLRDHQRVMQARITRARKQGEIDKSADPAALATIALSVMYSLAIRSRAGASKAELQAAADAVVAVICGKRRSG